MSVLRDISFLSAIIAAGSGILGAAVGSAVGGYAQSRNNRRELRHRLIKQKLEEFYGPLLAIRSRVLAKSELRLKISQIAGEEWPKLVTGPEKSHPDRVEQTQREKWPRFERSIEYASKQLEQEMLPSYREMVRVFIEKIFLAEPSTRSHLSELITFIEIWDQWISDSLPAEVLNRLDHSEKRLYPFYEDLENRFTALQSELRGS